MSQSQQGFQLPQPGVEHAVFQFEGHGIYEWDPAKQKYVGTWVDNMLTALALAEGTSLPDGTEFEMMTITYTRRR